jgi:hypothetical protein
MANPRTRRRCTYNFTDAENMSATHKLNELHIQQPYGC